MYEYNPVTVMGDRATQECDLSTIAAPNGMGLVSLLMPTLYEHAGGCKALNAGGLGANPPTVTLAVAIVN